MPFKLRTTSYELRTWRTEDLPGRYPVWLNDEELMASIDTTAREVSLDDILRMLEPYDNKSKFHIGIYRRSDDLPIGFYQVQYGRRSRTASISVIIGEREFWGKKVVAETRRLLIDFLFSMVDVEKIGGMPMARNIPSVFNYKAQGFTHEGTLRKHVVDANGQRADVFVFGLLRDEWRAGPLGARRGR
jgi:ribosomal-protein-alanine N-acetyltransferase